MDNVEQKEQMQNKNITLQHLPTLEHKHIHMNNEGRERERGSKHLQTLFTEHTNNT